MIGIRSTAILLAIFTAIAALAGLSVARLWPAQYEFVAFVHSGSLGADPLADRTELLETFSGLATAAAVGEQLNRSPWDVWRKYSLSSEGAFIVLRVEDRDPSSGLQLTEAVRDALVRYLRQRFEAARRPHEEYTRALESDVQRLSSDTQSVERQLAGAAGGLLGMSLRADAVVRRLVLAEIQKQLRDEQVVAALSHAPSVSGPIRQRAPDQRTRQFLLVTTGAFLGFAAGAVLVAVRLYRAYAPQGFAGV